MSNALINNEYRRKDKETHRDTTNEALVASGKSRSQSRGAPQFCIPKDVCAYCHQKGHWKADCPAKKKVNDTEDSNANITLEEDIDLAFIGSSLDIYPDEWIFDTGCSYHMCPNRDLFSSFDELDGDSVLTGNGHACKTLGIGKISLVLYDESVFVLSDVRYVPSLKQNLISLGALESTCLVISMQGGALEISSKNQVVMRGTQRNNLYFLEGSKAEGGATTVIGEFESESTANLSAEVTESEFECGSSSVHLNQY